MKLELVTDPAEEPVTLAEAKAHLRLDDGAEDGLVEGYIVAAREWAETALLWRALVQRTYNLYFDGWPRFPLKLPMPPLLSVEGIYCTDADGNETEWDSANYHVDTHGRHGRIVLADGASFPSEPLRPVNGVRVQFTAGYGGAGDVPRVIKQGLLLLVADLYENREDSVVGAGNSLIQAPFGVRRLLRPYQAKRFV